MKHYEYIFGKYMFIVTNNYLINVLSLCFRLMCPTISLVIGNYKINQERMKRKRQRKLRWKKFCEVSTQTTNQAGVIFCASLNVCPFTFDCFFSDSKKLGGYKMLRATTSTYNQNRYMLHLKYTVVRCRFIFFSRPSCAC